MEVSSVYWPRVRGNQYSWFTKERRAIYWMTNDSTIHGLCLISSDNGSHDQVKKDYFGVEGKGG